MLGGVDRLRERAHVLVDPRGVAVGRGTLGLGANPVAGGAGRRAVVARLPEGQRQQPQHRLVARVGVAREHEPAGGELEVALGQRVLGRGHEALDAFGARVGLAEVDELQRAGRHGADPGLEGDARPLLDVVAAAREVDAVDAAHAPLRIGQAARVAVHDRVVGHARGERVVLGLVGVLRALALLLRVRAGALLGAALAGRGRRDLDRVLGDAPAARVLGDRGELVGGLVDRLQVPLVLVLLAGRRDVRMPLLREAAARELDVALVERWVDLQEKDGLFNIQHLRHDPLTVPRAGNTGVPSAPPRCCRPGDPYKLAGPARVRPLVPPTHDDPPVVVGVGTAG